MKVRTFRTDRGILAIYLVFALLAVEVLASARRRSRGAGGDAEGGQVWTSSEPLGGGR